MVALGTGVNKAAIYTRGGEYELLKVENPNELFWQRSLNAASAAYAVVSKERAAECVAKLGQAHAWAHELVMFRDEERVWEGPIRRMSFTRNTVRVDALDVLGWLTRRRIRVNRRTTVDRDVTFEGNLILERAFEPDDPNVMPFVRVIDEIDAVPVEQAQITRDVRANSGLYSDDLASLASQGLRFTTIGRRIVLWPDEVQIGRTLTIQPENHMVTEVEISEEGDDLATRMTGVNSDERAETVTISDTIDSEAGDGPSGVHEFYGLHDLLADAGDVRKAAGLRRVARRALAGRFPTPELVTVPQGAKLDCDAPVEISELVCGTVVPIESTITARKVSATMILTDLQVKASAAGEEVTVSLTPPSDIGEVSA